MNTTTQPETANVTVEKVMDWAISSQASETGKVQRLGSNPVGFKRSRSAEHLLDADDDVVRAASKDAEMRIQSVRVATQQIPATNMGMDIRETLEGLIN